MDKAVVRTQKERVGDGRARRGRETNGVTVNGRMLKAISIKETCW